MKSADIKFLTRHIVTSVLRRNFGHTVRLVPVKPCTAHRVGNIRFCSTSAKSASDTIFDHSSSTSKFEPLDHLGSSSGLSVDQWTVPEPPTGNQSLIQNMDQQGSSLTDTVTSFTPDMIEFFNLDSWWTPAGWVRIGLQVLHQYTGLPWWEVIVLGVLAGRILLFPFTMKTIRYADKMRFHHNKLSELGASIQEAHKIGDSMKGQVALNAYVNYMTANGLSLFAPLKNMIPMTIYFSSFYFAIKRMAEAPIESFKGEGILWFQNLALCDPIYVLPVICSALLAVTMKVGAEVEFAAPSGPGISPETVQKLMTIVFPLGVLLCTPFFPSALVLYWCTSNVISLILAIFLRSALVRSILKLAPLNLKKL